MVKKKKIQIYFYFIPPTSQSPSKEGQTVFFLLQGYSGILDTHTFLPLIFTDGNIIRTMSCTRFCPPEASSAPAHVGLSHPILSLTTHRFHARDGPSFTQRGLLLGSPGAKAVIHNARESILAHSFPSLSLL